MGYNMTAMRIPFAAIQAELAPLRRKLDAAIARVLDCGQFILGAEVEAFERELAQAAGAAYAVGVSSGTDALLASLMALGIGKGDDVVTTPFSFFATAGVIARLGARPVFADIDEASFNLDPAKAANACTDKTRAIIPVHLYGRPAALPDTPIPIVEDAAQCVTAGVRGRCACTSFFPTKNLGGIGDGGAVLTNDRALAERLRVLRLHGALPKHFHAMVGGNFRLDTVHAAVLRVKLPYLEKWNSARCENADLYRTLFSAANVPPEVRPPEDAPGHVYNQFVIRAPRRDELSEHMRRAGVATAVYYPRPLHAQECFAHLGYEQGAFPVAEKAAVEVLALPMYPSLTVAQQEYVVATVSAFYAG